MAPGARTFLPPASCMSAPVVHGEIESPRPLRAPGGQISLRGWCLLAGNPTPPSVRLVAGEHILPAATHQARPDLGSAMPHEPAAGQAGFVVTGRLPAGVHLAVFEAQMPDGTWQAFKRLSLAVEAPPFLAALDEPISAGVLRDRVKVGGWALAPDQPVASVHLRYGHREIACVPHQPRADVAAAYPTTPHAARAGFVSDDFLVAGHGPVRIKARLADGRTVITPTAVNFSIATDENHGPDLDLTAPHIGLEAGSRPAPAGPPPAAAAPLNLLFILYGNFISNSANQVAALANEFAAAGHDCLVSAPRDPETAAHLEAPRFRTVLHADLLAGGVRFRNGRGPDIIHAWTTREGVRATAQEIQRRQGGRLVVHLEDNEREILAQTLRRPWAELAALPEADLNPLITDDLFHPRRSQEFLSAAQGVTTLLDRLNEFAPPRLPRLTFWPAADARSYFPRPAAAFRASLQLEPGTTVLFYHGNAHAANAGEMRMLYEAVLLLNRTGHPTRLIRTGVDQTDFLGDLTAEVAPHVLALGLIPHHRHLAPLMALADYFVQPGLPDAFNDYRFPSKLPEFFSLGRPVILPRTNLGLSLRHGIDAYVLDRADAEGIAGAVRALRNDPELNARLSRGAVAFAEEHFSWRRSAAALASFYRQLAVS